MTPTPVGMRCPECAREKTPVRTLRSGSTEPTATIALIGLNVIAFLAALSSGAGAVGSSANGTILTKGGLFGPAIHINHEYWRLVTSGFLHLGFLHILFNMYLLYVIGRMIEPAIGSARFLLLYFTALLAGSFGALLVSPDSLTVGASGAVFGLMGAAFVGMRARGIDPMQTGIGGLILINLVLTFAFSGISIGGHIGGLIAGVAAGWLLLDYGARTRNQLIPVLGTLAIAVGSVIGALAVAGGNGL